MEAARLGAAGAAGLHKAFCPKAARELVGNVDAFLFDCDGGSSDLVWSGVIWKGEKLIEGVTKALQALRSMGKKVGFVTNNSTKSRKQYVEKFRGLGISVHEDEIYPSSFGAAMYLKVNNFPQDKKVYAIGGDGILEEMSFAGYTCLGVTKDANKKMELKRGFKFEHDKSVGAVVVGLDPYINYYKIQYATMCIRENPGCLFIATDRDAVGPLTDVQEWPGTGSMVGAICGSTQKEPIIVGKPATFMMEFLLKRFNMSTSRMCMVGDSFPDVLFGQNSGCKTILVLSGV
ncbi:hypothetical protein Taro_015176 [Colocasia esculenta]|uniref:Phosphoglycolate phosphatase n=1 Tax=Colocasia esculenta TaxID=4460 RepID=A0A843UAV7_COLES|nr:hypothetical protein [Colocasia esculenta]